MACHKRQAKQLGEGCPPRRAPLSGMSAVALAFALLASSCGTPSSGVVREERPLTPVQGLTATLEDEVRDLADGRIKWSTYWKLCWDEYPGATAYELQTITSEGTSPKLRRQSERCFRIEAAANVNKKSQGLRNRDELLALQMGQLFYRVRAVIDGTRTSAWSPPMELGKASKTKARTEEAPDDK